MKSKCISNISDENLASKLKYTVSIRVTPDFKELVQTSNVKNMWIKFYIDYTLKW